MVVSVYAPTMNHTDEVNYSFYGDLERIISPTSRKDELILLGDFSTWVGSEHVLWPKALGKQRTVKRSSKGELLLSKCAAHKIFIANTAFQQADKYKNDMNASKIQALTSARVRHSTAT